MPTLYGVTPRGIILPRASGRTGFRGEEFQRGLDPVWAVELRAEERRRPEVVTDPPRQVPLDAGRAVIVPVGVVGQPVVGDRAVTPLGECEQRDQVPAGRDLPGVRRPVAAAGDEESP